MTVVAFGDSIAAGQYVSPHLAWVTRVAVALPDHLVVNAGRNGDTTRLALERLAYDVTWYRPDVVVVQFGLNDCNTRDGRVRVSGPAFSANLVEIVDAIACPVVLVENHRTAKGELYDSTAEAYNERIRWAAGATDAVLVTPGEVPLLDGIHPSSEGHARYADAILPAIRAVLG